jgi:hypothetical protein
MEIKLPEPHKDRALLQYLSSTSLGNSLAFLLKLYDGSHYWMSTPSYFLDVKEMR